MLATMLAGVQRWLSWPVSPEEITIPGALCPVDPATNTPQPADAALLDVGWQGVFTATLLTSIGVALVAVWIAYRWPRTPKIGLSFVARWWQYAGIAALSGLAASLALLLLARVPTEGCANGVISARIPMLWVGLRALLGAAHAALFFVVWSVLSTAILGRWLQWPRWYDNHRVPLPYFTSRTRG